MSSPSLPAASSAPTVPARTAKRNHPRTFRIAVLLLIAAVGSLFIPPVYLFLVRQALGIIAFKAGASIHVGGMDGSILEPVTFTNVDWSTRSSSGVSTRIEIKNAEADFSWRWRDLALGSDSRFFRRLSVRDASVKIELPPLADSEAKGSRPAEPEEGANTLPVPERLEASGVNLTISSSGDSVQVQDCGWVFSRVEPGTIRAKTIAVHEPWLSRSFRDVSGTTAIQESRAIIANLVLEPKVELRSIAADLGELESGKLNLEAQLSAFGGNIRAQMRTLGKRAGGGIDASGAFSQIGVAPLASFLSLSEAAGGTIKDGQFTFRGMPRKPMRSTASLRFTAMNFQWESRQWDSLVLGATLIDGRLDVPEFDLRQGHNSLIANGSLSLPQPNVQWWQSDFDINLSAKIENLTELSALMLPEFTYTAGRMNIDGEVRGRDEQFNGSVIVSGSGINWRGAPIESLHAAVRLDGNNVQISNLGLLNNNDFVEGRGGINILGPKQYWGEFRASIGDLGVYSSILQKPLTPKPLAGGARIDWAGEGSEKGFSGKFTAKLNRLRTLDGSGALLHPIDADLAGDYSQSSIQFSRFSLADDASSFSANVRVDPALLSFANIRLIQNGELCLEGDAMLPLDIWQSWPNTTLDQLLSDKTAGKIQLKANSLGIGQAARLTGWKWPIAGVLSGELSGEGTLGALVTNGELKFENGRIPLGWSGSALEDVDGAFEFSGQTIKFNSLAVTTPGQSRITSTGSVDFTNIRNPLLAAELHSDRYRLQLLPDALGEEASAEFLLNLRLSGRVGSLLLEGEAAPLSINLEEAPDLTKLCLGQQIYRLPPVTRWKTLPWGNWQFSINCRSSQPIPIGTEGGSAMLDLRLSGHGADSWLEGTATFDRIPVWTPGGYLTLRESSLTFLNGLPSQPLADIDADGELFGTNLEMFAAGPLANLTPSFVCTLPLPADKLISRFAAAVPSLAEPVREDWLQMAPFGFLTDIPSYNIANYDSGAPAAEGQPEPVGAEPKADQATRPETTETTQ